MLMKSKKAKKRKRSEEAIEALIKENIDFKILPGDYHVKVVGQIQYWPSTGKWYCENTNKRGRGMDWLIRHVKKIQ